MIPTIQRWLQVWGAEYSVGIEKITLRAMLAAAASFVIALAIGPHLIGWLKRRFREPNSSPSRQLERLHAEKAWTPTMGGLFIVAGILLAGLAFADLSNPFVWITLLAIVLFATLGAVDDLLKLRSGKRGLAARHKLLAQVGISLAISLLVYSQHVGTADALSLSLPFRDQPLFLGVWFIPLATVVLVGSSNAVNLTDGLDGLAGGCLVFSVAAMAGLVYFAGHARFAEYLQVTHIPNSGEVVVLAGATLGGLLGFLWFNCHPAQVFMGDTGSLPLGGFLGLMAIVARQELLLVVIAGVFVVEAASVICQVCVFRAVKKRVFRCAPLHHHFQFLGWPESRIVVRFWIAAALCALLGISSTKLAPGDLGAGDRSTGESVSQAAQ